MKNIFLFLTLFASSISFAQTDTTYFNEQWVKCPKAGAFYYRIVEKQGAIYLVREMYSKTNTIKMLGSSTTPEPVTKNGQAMFFYPSGAKYMAGNFVNNNPNGSWTRWEENGKDSSITQYNSDGTTVPIRKAAAEIVTEKETPNVVEQMPTYKGGEQAMSEFIKANIVYPKKERDNNITGKCYVAFIIEKDGSVSDVKVLRGVPNGPGCDKEAIRVVSMMPDWNPGVQGGKPVRVQFNLPISFSLNGKKKK